MTERISVTPEVSTAQVALCRLEPGSQRDAAPSRALHHVQLSELWIRELDVRACALLCMLEVSPPVGQGVTLFALDELAPTFRDSSQRGAYACDVQLGALPEALQQASVRMVLSIYRVVFGASARRLIEDCRRSIESLNYRADPAGSRALAESIQDRLEALAQLPGFGLLVRAQSAQTATPSGSHVAWISGDCDGSRFVAHAGRLEHAHALPDSAAAPSSFVLLEVGRPLSARARLVDAFHAERPRAPTRGAEGAEGESYAQRDRRLRKTRDLAVRFGSAAMEANLFAYPIVVFIASDLSSLFGQADGQLSAPFADGLRLGREAVYAESGFRVPAVRVSVLEVLSERHYTISLLDRTVASGVLDPSRLFVAESNTRLRALGLVGEGDTDPIDGSPCTWISLDQEPEAQRRGVTTYGAEAYLLRHLFAVLRRHAAQLLQIEDTWQQLRAVNPELAAQVSQAAGGLARLTTVLRLLLTEGASIHVLRPLVLQYLELSNSELHNEAIVEQLRSGDAVRPHLAVNKRQHGLVELGPRFLAAIRAGVERGKGRVLALETEVWRALSNRVRSYLRSTPLPKEFALLVEDGALRGHVRRLIEFDFPLVPVVSSRELLDAASTCRVGVLELDSYDCG